MIEHDSKTNKDSEWLASKTRRIMEKRTPSAEEIVYDPTIEYLDPDNKLTKEERGRVIAMGDRTAISYNNLASKVLSERDNPGKTSSFYLAYSLAARSSKEISHTSILEQINPGPTQEGGDPPIIMEGISILTGLRDICSLRHCGFEAYSSRGAIFPDNYWRIPQELKDAGIGEELQELNKELYQVYLSLTEKGVNYYLRNLDQREGEEDWRYEWRVLNSALDDSRQITNQSFLNHLSMHPNSALSLREAIVILSSMDLPETQGIANQLRELGQLGLPTLMKYTDPSPFNQSFSGKREHLRDKLGLDESDIKSGKSGFLGASISPNAVKEF